MRIELIGGMGAGKTTLCRSLERIGLQCVYQSPRKNPFLDLSYKDPRRFAFYSQISFITGNFHTASRFRDWDGITFLDFSTINDRAYASMFLRGEGRLLAQQMIDYLEEKEGRAELYLHLTCPLETQARRIRRRKRPHENRVGPKFLAKLNAHIDRHVQAAERGGARILTVDTTHIDLQEDMEFITNLTKSIRQALQTPYTWNGRAPANSDSPRFQSGVAGNPQA